MLLIMGLGVFACLTEVPLMSLYNGWILVDQLSLVMFMLTCLVGLLSLSCSGPSLKSAGFVGCVVMSTMASLGFFSSAGLFFFFIFFEAGLVPLVGLILGWGYQPERLQACLCLILYTVVGSLPLLGVICWHFLEYCSDTMIILKCNSNSLSWGVWLFVILSFLVKMPVFGVHGWLPKAHVEAPAAGSMILAGVLLKFGCYGLMRLMWCFGWSGGFLGDLLVSVGVWGGVMSSLICLVQSDLKSLIAYSSISHMSLVLVGILSCSGLGWNGSLLMMFCHGLSSPVLFGLANYVYYIYQSRSMMVCKGLLCINPLLCFLLFSGSVIGMGCPPSGNFFSEVMMVGSGCLFSWYLVLPMGLMGLLSAAYSLYLFSSVSHGGYSSSLKSSLAVFPGLVCLAVCCYWLFLLCLGLDFFCVN
uniref:NADH-ubiquinone oxidoreductase chain 4 n=1 Tax=Vasticardium flavum TaxID=80826 RepID=A0A516IEG3_9BIVA|nr:NADH dehydrogenase subunit 4 [Vasticardium flavum]